MLTNNLLTSNSSYVKDISKEECQKQLKNQEEKVSKLISEGLRQKILKEIEKKLNLALNFEFKGINNNRDKEYKTGNCRIK